MAVAAPSRRLNPFAFPSETDYRFALLVAAIVAATLFMHRWIYTVGPEYRQKLLASVQPSPPLRSQDDWAREMRRRAVRQAPLDRGTAAGMLAGTVLLIGVAGTIFALAPVVKLRRDKLEPLSTDDAPDVLAALMSLCQEAEISPPTFVWSPLNSHSGALAFGRRGRYFVALTGGLVTQFYTDLPGFRAVLRHELAHLHARDVEKAYFSLALWQAFLVAALLPFTFHLLSYPVSFRLAALLTAGALTSFVYLLLNGVLRAREFYADARASEWDGPDGALRRVLEKLPRTRENRAQAWLRVHPDPARRRETVDDTRALLRLEFGDAFAAGLLTAIALPSAAALVGAISGGMLRPSLYAPLGAALVFAPLIVGSVGLGVWRGTWAARASGEPERAAGTAGLGVGLGLILGQFLSFEAVTDRFLSTPQPVGVMLSLLFLLFWNALVLTTIGLFFFWMAASASVWLDRAAETGKTPRAVWRPGELVASGILTWTLGVLWTARTLGDLLPNISDLTAGLTLLFTLLTGLPMMLTLHPLTTATLTALWAFPLAAAPRRQPVRAGLLAGLFFCGLLLGLRLLWRLFVPLEIRDSDGGKLTLFYMFNLAPAFLVQILVAVVVAARVPRSGALHGLCAAFVAACVISVGILGWNLTFGGTLDAKFATDTALTVVNGGGLLALLPAVLASSWAGRKRSAMLVG